MSTLSCLAAQEMGYFPSIAHFIDLSYRVPMEAGQGLGFPGSNGLIASSKSQLSCIHPRLHLFLRYTTCNAVQGPKMNAMHRRNLSLVRQGGSPGRPAAHRVAGWRQSRVYDWSR